jgi:hypothetical protein
MKGLFWLMFAAGFFRSAEWAIKDTVEQEMNARASSANGG